ncbi:MAG: helix-turn-helix transcriptional regulator [Ruminococcaceae bacterium]|nr:helix-turn-helix transcriptional regulator [Oscillospiraceae bacterium]
MQIDVINTLLYEDLKVFKYPIIYRGFNLIMLVESGTCKVTLGDKKKSFELHAGEIALMPANTEIHREVIDALTFYQIAFYTNLENPIYRVALSGKLVLTKEQSDVIFQSIRRAYPLTNNNELIEQIIGYIFTENYLFGKSKKDSPKVLSEAVTDTIQYMNQHLSERIEMEYLAERVYLSHCTLIYKFKNELGTTPAKYLIHLRLRYAKHLLMTTNYSITQISEMCGYSNPFYFTNAFHKYAKKNPTDFRAYHLKDKK